MGSTSAPDQTSRTRLVHRSDRNYDELVRDYIRGARERLEAARQWSPPATGTSLPPSDSSAISNQPRHAHSVSTAIALPSPSAQWPLPGPPQTWVLDSNNTELPPHQPAHEQHDLHATNENGPRIDFNERPAKVLAAAAPQLAARSPSNLPPPSQHHQRQSSRTHSRAPSIPTIREGLASHVHTPSKASPMFLKTEKRQSHEDRDDNELDPFRDDGHRGLVREASVGRSHRPVLTEIVSRASQEQRRSADQARYSVSQAIPRTPTTSLKHIRAGVAVTDTPDQVHHISTPISDGFAFRSGTALLTPNASIKTEATNRTEFATTPLPALSSKLEGNTLHRPGTSQSVQSSAASFRLGCLPAPNGQSSLGERVGSRKPPPLNLDVVKEAENRGSLSSLPDLIQRALRLASNLEHGKASRRFDNEAHCNKITGRTPRIQSSGVPLSASRSYLSLPNADTQNTEGKKSGWPRSAGLHSSLRRSYIPSLGGSTNDAEKKRLQRRRRCCGMPLWLFALIVALVFVLIVAAILVPIFVIVIPQEASSTNSCAHGAMSITSATGSQECICVDGYTGTACSRDDGSGCTSITLDTVNKATVGSLIPAVLTNAATDYAINLNASVLLPLFSALDMTCASETSLVDFKGLTSRALLNYRPQFVHRHKASPTITADNRSMTSAPKPLDLRPRHPQTLTQDGIVFAQSSSSMFFATPSSTTAVTPTATATSLSTFSPTSDYTLGFARTAVLYILQNGQELIEAQSAHSKLYLFLADPSAGDPTNLDLGGGWSVNLEEGTISDGDGTSVGA